MKRTNRLIAALLALMMLLALAACGSNSTPAAENDAAPAPAAAAEKPDADEPAAPEAPEAQEGVELSEDAAGNTVYTTAGYGSYDRVTDDGTLTIGVIYDVDNFDPATSQGFGSFIVYDTLFTRDAEGNIEPLLAESYEYVDECTLKIKLHEGVYFTNGEELNAEDVLYSLSRFYDVGSRFASYWNLIDFDESYCEDDYTVVFKTTSVFAPLIKYLATRQSSIVNKEWCENAADEDWWDAPCGTGPYTVVENIDGSHTTYAKKADYWAGDIYDFDTITVKNYSEGTTMFVDYENGVLDVAYGISSSDVDLIAAGAVDATKCTLSISNEQLEIMLPDLENGSPFSDINVRKAFAHAIDYEAMAAAIQGNLWTPADTMSTGTESPQTVTGFFEYDPDYAIECLAEAGYGPGDLSIELVIVDDAVNVKMAEIIQAYLADIGVNLTISPYDFPTALTYFQSGTSGFQIIDYSNALLDPDYQLDSCGYNYTDNVMARNSNEDFNNFMELGRATLDEDERAEYYQQAFQVMHDEYWWLPICNVTVAVVQRDYIDNAILQDYQYINLRYVTAK